MLDLSVTLHVDGEYEDLEDGEEDDEEAQKDEEFPELQTGLYGLVTSAFHMPRAVGVFRKSGIAVVPIPVDYRSDRGRAIVFGQGIVEWERFALAVREWGGLFFYFALGRTDHVFPSPTHSRSE